MSTSKAFIWDTESELELINRRLQNEAIFEHSKNPWKELRELMIQDGFDSSVSVNDIEKKWSSIVNHYHIAVKSNHTEWTYYNLFQTYVDAKDLNDYDKWNNEWIIKLIESRCKHNSLFLHVKCDNNIGWITVQHDLKETGLPIEFDAICIKNMWFSLIDIFKKNFKVYPSNEKCFNPWPFFEYILLYYVKYDPETLNVLKTEAIKSNMNDINVMSEVSDSNDSDFELEEGSNDDSKSHSGEFRWDFEWTERFIRIRSENEHLFKKKYGAWKKLHNIVMKSGFPSTVTSDQLVTKWSYLYNKYQKALSSNCRSWVYYNIMSKYLGKMRRKDKCTDWNEEWIKKLIEIRTDMDSMFKKEELRINRKCWGVIEAKLIASGIPITGSTHNIADIWSSLIKTFKARHKLIIENRLSKKWKFYDVMLEHFLKCDPDFFDSTTNSNIVNVKVENDNISNFDNELKDGHKSFIKVEYFDSDLCRVCLGSFETTVPLFGIEDNIADKIMSCTEMTILPTDNMPQKLCRTCLEQLNIVLNFRKKCEESDRQMKHILMLNKNHDYPYNMHYVDTKIENESNESDSSLDLHFTYTTVDDDNIADEKVTGKSMHSEEMNHDFVSDSKNENWRDKTKMKKSELRKRQTKSSGSRKEIRNKSVHKVKQKRIINKHCANKTLSTTDRKKYIYYKMCEICGRVTTRLKVHMLSHTSDKTFKCSTCSSTFRYLANLKCHMRVHESTPHKVCQICGMEFSKTEVYKKHLLKHDSKRYSCNICNRSFNTPDVLTVHKRIHTGKKPHACDICGKHFYTKACVRRHQKVHRNLEKQLKPQE